MLLIYKFRKYALFVLFAISICCFSLSAEARFGGGGSHSSSHSSFSSHSYSRGASGGRMNAATAAFLALIVGVFTLFWVGAAMASISNKEEASLPKNIDKKALTQFFKNRFMELQVLWDEDNWDKINGYVNKEMLRWLKSKREATKATQAPKTVIKNLRTRIKSYSLKDNLVTTIIEFKGTDNDGQFTEDWEMVQKDEDWCLVKLTSY